MTTLIPDPDLDDDLGWDDDEEEYPPVSGTPDRGGSCGGSGGQGIGAGHVCVCIRPAGHPLDSDRPHGCECGALWAGGE